MALTLIEAAVDAVKSYLSDNMAVKLAALNAEYDDSITLASIQQYYVAEMQAVPQSPAVFILGDRTDIDAEGMTHIKGSHSIAVVILATDVDTEVLRKRLYRYVRAIVELLREGREDGTIGHAIVFDGLEYSTMYGKSGTFLQDACVKVRLTRIDTE